MRTLFLAAFIALPATSGTFTVISVPDANYVSGTTLLNISDPLQSIVTLESQAALSVSFFSGTQPLPMDVNQVGDAWATWGVPPANEIANPIVVAPDDPTVHDIVLVFNKRLITFGMEVEPDDTTANTHKITATFFLGSVAVGSIQKTVSGNGGAVLFASTGTTFDSVEVASDIRFAAARLRYLAATLAPTSLGGTLTGKTGPQNGRLWSFTITNPGPGATLSAQATSFTLTQTSGAACTPVVNGPKFPVALGDIAAAGSAPLNVTIDFTGCAGTAKFRLSVPLTANSGAATGNIVRMNEFR
jgi:hypothetical protein